MRQPLRTSFDLDGQRFVVPTGTSYDRLPLTVAVHTLRRE
jgi:hypothetical protein